MADTEEFVETRTVHMCLDIRGALRNPRKWLKDSFRTEDGKRYMTMDEAHDALMDQLAMGRRVLPIGECEGFDYQTGCPGHPSRTVPTVKEGA